MVGSLCLTGSYSMNSVFSSGLGKTHGAMRCLGGAVLISTGAWSFGFRLGLWRASLVAQMVKNLILTVKNLLL